MTTATAQGGAVESSDRPRSWAVTRVLSVGTKLASATIALMLLVTALLYFQLTAYQREKLLEAKQSAATAVTRLFVESCSAPIVFGDDGAISEALVHLQRGGDVPYAAVWSSDAAGQARALLAKVGSGAPVEVRAIPAVLELQRESERLVLFAPVRDINDKLVGVAALTFSLARENQLIGEVRTNTLFASAAIAGGLTLLLLAIARFAIVRPLGKLLVAANALERGTSTDIDVHSSDEIGQLAAAFRSMSQAIISREQRIQARNRDMRLVLDNVGDGFITLDQNARLSDEHSRVIEEWFGPPERGSTFWDYLGRADSKLAQMFELGWTILREDMLPLEICLDQLPRGFRAAERTFELAYRPILKDDRLEQLLVVITDVTEHRARERAQLAEREMMCVFKHILSGRNAFDEFFDEAAGLVAKVQADDASDLQTVKRHIHTLKGSCAIFGLESVAEYCHELETELEVRGGGVSADRKRELGTLWTRVGAMRAQFAVEAAITVNREEHRALCLALEARAPAELVARLAAWQFDAASSRLALLGKQMQELAVRFGKAEVRLVIDAAELRLPKQWAPLWAALSHVVRNTIDHGIELAEERTESGKPAHAQVILSLHRVGQEVVLGIADDGRGINWTRIAERARSLDLPATTEQELQDALFAQGVSSRTEVTTTSGRGVGLSAVRDVVAELGGHISVKSQLGKGTTFQFYLPQAMLGDAQPAAPEQLPGARTRSMPYGGASA